MSEQLLTLEEIAPMVGVTLKSIRVYHGKANRRRREGTVGSVDMPPPDRRLSRTPVWERATIEEWIERRNARASK